MSAMAPILFGASQAPRRLHSNIDDSETFPLKGNVRPVVELGLAQDRGAVPGSQVLPRMYFHFAMTAAQRADLTHLLAEQQDRNSPQFHKFLTPEQYAARFGLNTADIEKITLWLESNGFANVQAARGRNWVSFSGTAAQVQSAFHTAIHSYALKAEAHIANAGSPQLPKALRGTVEGIRGLHDFSMKPHVHLRPHLTVFTGSGVEANFLAPDDWTTIYDVKPLYSAGLDGGAISGQTYSIAVAGQSDVQNSDIDAFRALGALPAKDPTTIVPPGDPDPGLQQNNNQVEADLDLEWAGAIAKNANILFVTAGGSLGVTDAITYAIDNNVAPILVTSYGACEADLTPAEFNSDEALYKQANAEGMTIIAASGNVGAADCDVGVVLATQGLAVDYPAASQYVTAVGGTEFNEGSTLSTYWNPTNNSSNGSAKSYIPEVAWNDGNAAATGGGASKEFTKPAWQTGTGVPNDNARDVPDLAFAASPFHDPYLTCSQGNCANSGFGTSGGTSIAAPSFAGVLALLVQKTGSPLGNINPTLYSLAAASTNVFHDIAAGSNIVRCQPASPNCPSGTMGYSAGVGYDQATGWGSLDVNNFVEQWPTNFQVALNPTALTIPHGNSGTTAITITPQDNFAGTVSFTCSVSASLANVSCSIPGTLKGSGSVTLTVTAASNANTPVWRFHKLPLGPWWILLGLALAAALYSLRKRRAVYAWGAAALFVFALGAVSCGGGSSGGGGSTAESGQIIVTGTSGQLSDTATLSVTVQ